VPLTERNSPSKTAIAKWAPQGHSVAYVEENDLYVATSANFSSAIRVTNNGNETIFNGIPDWAYEEEVFGSDSAVWWSPDGKKLAYLSFDESEVQVYSYPIYNPDRFSPGASSYPKSADMRYPKPGSKRLVLLPEHAEP
jgi:dipeptidyl aminopeptidase